jgi:hypothetical protein
MKTKKKNLRPKPSTNTPQEILVHPSIPIAGCEPLIFSISGTSPYEVAVDFHSSGYRLNALGQEFMLTIVGLKATKKSIRDFCPAPENGRCFSWLVFRSKTDALEAFERMLTIASSPQFWIEDSRS